MKNVLVAFGVVLLTACGGVTDVVKTGPDTYMIASHSTMGWSSGSAQKAKAFQEADAYCQRNGRQVESIGTKESPGGFGRIASGEVQFRCVKVTDSATKSKP